MRPLIVMPLELGLHSLKPLSIFKNLSKIASSRADAYSASNVLYLLVSQPLLICRALGVPEYNPRTQTQPLPPPPDSPSPRVPLRIPLVAWTARRPQRKNEVALLSVSCSLSLASIMCSLVLSLHPGLLFHIQLNGKAAALLYGL